MDRTLQTLPNAKDWGAPAHPPHDSVIYIVLPFALVWCNFPTP
jgi:hypothetical protein